MGSSLITSTPKCLFCEHSNYRATPFEDTVFNDKTFKYLQCNNCDLVYVHPLPDSEDLQKMYPVEYQGELAVKPTGQYKSLLDKIKTNGTFHSLLDYGCGGGRFISEAIIDGFNVTGTEYNPELIKNLKLAFPSAHFLTIDDFIKTDSKFDVIFLSNVLEHLTNPKEIMLLLKSRLNPKGIFVIEGPVENNFNLTKFTRKSIFWIRKNLFNKKASHTPTHVLYANMKNQEDFLKSLGLETVYYKIDESHWPFPSNFKEANSIMKKIMFLVAATSVKIGKNFSFWGNNFIYIGKIR